MTGSDQPFFSIVLPTYNAEKYITRSIQSILKQEFKNFECLIIDGESSDDTLLITQDLISNDSRFELVSEADFGVYDAMNKGVLKSKGKYLYFLGADDYLFDGKVLLEVQSNLANTNIDVLYGNVNRKDLWNHYDGEFNEYKIASQNLCHQSIFYKKNVFDKVGSYNLKYKIQADWEHNWRWFFHPEIKHKHLDKIIAYYEQGGLSSGKKDLEFRRDFVKKFIRNSRLELNLIQALFILAKTFVTKVIFIKW